MIRTGKIQLAFELGIFQPPKAKPPGNHSPNFQQVARLVRLILFSTMMTSPLVQAHNGLPESVSVTIEDPSDALPLVFTTFGVLAPRSANDWTWTCFEVADQQTKVYAFGALQDGTWFLGTVYGLYRSSDRCYWSPVAGPVGSLFVTQVQPDTANPARLWVTTSSGGEENALWLSDDGGATFEAGAHFGEGSTLRSFAQGKDGAPFFINGWRDSLPYVWYSPDGQSWQEILLEEASRLSVYILDIDAFYPNVVWLRYSNSEEIHDQLVRLESDGTRAVMLEIDDALDSFASGFAENELFAGGELAGMYHSLDGGASWQTPAYLPEAGCLRTIGDQRFQCTDNYTDGFAIQRWSNQNMTPESILWFGNVHDVESCPSDSETAQICGDLWETYKYTIGLDLEDEDASPTPTPLDSSSGCSCESMSHAHEGSGAGILLFILAGMYRRRRKVFP